MSDRTPLRTLPPTAQTVDLERALLSLFGSGASPVTIIERSPLPYRSTFPVEDIVAWVADRGERRLVFKDLSRGRHADPAWRVKARFLHDPLREIDTYREVLAPEGISAPAYLGSAVDARRDRYWLFLERVEGEPLWQSGDLGVWCRAARWLAGLHARFAGRTRDLPRRLLPLDLAHWRRWLARARRLGLRPGASPCTGRQLELLAERTERAARWLAGQPATFLHGEFYPSNILVANRADKVRIRPLDWEMAAIGPGVVDLAALTSGGWADAERAALAEAYRAGLPRRLRPTAADLQRGLDRCRLLLAVQWLGWSSRWAPPPEHQHDWLETALDLAAGSSGRDHPQEAAR